MSELVTIRPRKGSRKFTAIEGVMSQFSMIKSGDKEGFKETGEYKRERFPSSRQISRIKWSESKRMWRLKGYEKVTSDLQTELDKLVKGCKVKYPEGHIRAGHYIETADVYDRRDPFFIHDEVKFIQKEGEAVLDKERPLDKILLMGLEASSEFSSGGESINPLMSTRVRYVIVDKNIDSKAKKDNRTQTTKAVKLYDALTDAKKSKIALALQLISDTDVDRTMIDELMWAYLNDSTTKVSDNLTKQDFFIHICGTTNEELELRTLIAKGKKSGALKYQRNSGWMLFGNVVSRHEAGIYDYLSDPQNQEMIIRLEHLIKSNG
jgi:hypothetical protein